VVVGLFSAKHVNAQTEVGSALADGQIIVKIYVTVDQAGMPYGRPVSHFALLVVAPSGERSTLATDDAGTAALHLARGAYRVASVQPLAWNGHHYVWDLPLQVREGMHALDLTPRNAAETIATNAGGTIASSGNPIDASASTTSVPGERKDAATAPPAYLYKNPGEALLFSFLVPGVGQMYNGQVGKGVGLLMLSSGALVGGAVASSNSCGYGCNTAPLAIGASVALATWIYSMFDAYGTAKQHNEKMGFRVGRIPVTPHVGVARDGATTVGVSLAIR
jgi:TM2 domain-containing membrane protein YozV